MSLAEVRHWVFDMDGTLTVAVHDFAAIRVALAIPPEHDILTHLAALPADEAAAKHAWLLEHERDLALGSKPAVGAVELVRELAGRGYRLGILTRNARELAHVTLEAIGLADCFAEDDRSEERRVGKECRSRWSPYHSKKNTRASSSGRRCRTSSSVEQPEQCHHWSDTRERLGISAGRRSSCSASSFFFFQAEDGIRDHCVTGVQTCALPIFCHAPGSPTYRHRNSVAGAGRR